MTSQEKIYDIAIIGAGINGAAVAREASGGNLKVFICDQDDIGGATSSSSTKMIHGGLRYLEQYEFGLVYKALCERELMYEAAPFLNTPLRIVIPHAPHQRPYFLIQLGVWLYDLLSFKSTLPRSRALNLKTHTSGNILKTEFTRAFEYSDLWTKDNRLVILNLLDAQLQNKNLDIHPYTKCTKIAQENGVWKLTLTSTKDPFTSYEIKAKNLINASGPWVQETISDLYPELDQKHYHTHLVKGSHLIVRKLYDHEYAYLFQHHDSRVIFMIPYENDFTLIGTTEIEIDQMQAPCDQEISEEETNYLIQTVNEYLKLPISAQDIVSSYVGIRPLFTKKTGQKNASAMTRDYEIETISASPSTKLINIFGGKITTHRKLGEDTLKAIFPNWVSSTIGKEFPGHSSVKGTDYTKALRQNYPFLTLELAQHYACHYGFLAHQFLKGKKSLKDMGSHFGHHLYEAELNYLYHHEWATSPEALLFKRTKYGLFLSWQEQDKVKQWVDQRNK